MDNIYDNIANSLQNKIGFVERISNGDTYLVKAHDSNNRACWFLLKSTDINAKKLKNTIFNDTIDLTKYGKVLDSGWGHEPIIKPQ
jgi:hypothetical protein